MAEKEYKIYKLSCPGKESYIGQTKQKINERWQKGRGYKPNSKVGKAIAKYGWENIDKSILYENLAEEEANAIEVEEIEKLGGIEHPLVLNEQTGGSTGYSCSKEGKEKRSKNMKKFYKEHPEILKKKSDKQNHYYYEEHPELLVSVDQYSYDGSTFIATYNSLSEAERATGADHYVISKCLDGRASSAGGYRWVKHGKKLSIIQYHEYATRLVINQIDRDTGEIIATYNSLADAFRSTGIPQSNICRCLTGERSHAGGYKWEKAS